MNFGSLLRQDNLPLRTTTLSSRQTDGFLLKVSEKTTASRLPFKSCMVVNNIGWPTLLTIFLILEITPPIRQSLTTARPLPYSTNSLIDLTLYFFSFSAYSLIGWPEI